MNCAFGWAHFGDAGGGHNLIDASGLDTATLRALRWHTDLPPDAPSEWPAFYAGYAICDHYVVQFTEPDAGADRPGMVKTTLATVGIDGLDGVALADLRLHATSASSSATSPFSGDRPEGLGAVLDLLAESRPVYWLGISAYDTLLDHLWEVLSVADRANLVFGLLFAPSSVPYPRRDATYGVYLVPEQFRVRFDSTSIVSSDNPPATGETGQAVLNGKLELAVELGIDSPSLREWRHLARVSRHLDLAATLGPDELRSCAHLLSHLAPGPERGYGVKASVASSLVASSANASFTHVRGLRTLNLPDLGLDLEMLIAPWTAAVVGDPNRIDDLEAALNEVATHPRDQLCVSINSTIDGQIAARGPALVDYLEAALIGDRHAVFAALADRAEPEQIDTVLASVDGLGRREWVHEVARQAQLPMTHSMTCPTDQPTEAFRVHLAIPGHTPESRSQLASRCEPRDVVDAAVELNALVLVDLAAHAVHQDIDALMPPRLASRCWLAVLARAVEGGADPWAWLKPQDALGPILDALLEGDDNVRLLVAELSALDDIDLVSYSRRAEVWSIIDEPARSHLLYRTATAVVLDGSATASLEPALRSAVVGQKVMVAVAAIDVSKAIDALEALAPHANSDSAEAIAASVDLETDAARLGELVARMRWKDAARYIVAHASQRPDLSAAEVTSRRILSPFEILKIKVRGSIGSASANELSAGVHEIAVELYPHGPGQGGIWARAGGAEADLDQQGTGRQRWDNALAAVMTGAAGAPTLANLIDEMLQDYPRSRELEIAREAV